MHVNVAVWSRVEDVVSSELVSSGAVYQIILKWKIYNL